MPLCRQVVAEEVHNTENSDNVLTFLVRYPALYSLHSISTRSECHCSGRISSSPTSLSDTPTNAGLESVPAKVKLRIITADIHRVNIIVG